MRWKGLMAVMLAMALLAGCQAVDVIGKYAVKSFESVLEQSAAEVMPDGDHGGWSLNSPGGEQFFWSRDFSAKGQPDLMMSFDAKPFLAAGLKPEKLDPETYAYDSTSSVLQILSEKGAEPFTYDAEATPLEAFRQLVQTHRDSIGYHEALDHYNVKFGNGNMFEWAKDVSTNDKDIVFVLNPQPFIDAGVDPTNVEGWVFAKVETKDDQGKTQLVDKLLKPYNFE